jgi:transcriptional regulator with XRE-family HTH domain
MPSSRHGNGPDLISIWDTLGDYVETRRKDRGLSRRALAGKLKTDASYLGRVVQGKIRPTAKTCNRISDFFKDPRVIALTLAGWLEQRPPDGQGYDHPLADEVAGLLRDDADFVALFRIYSSKEPGERKAILRVVRAM